MLTVEQKQARKSGIGGSDVAAIMGLSPWKTANEVYLEKRGEIVEENIDDKEFVHFGNVLEEVVAQEYSRLTGEKVERRNKMLVHPKYPFLLANIDRKIVGRKAVLECKTTDKWARGTWGENGTDQVPDYYRTQIEHYFNVTGYSEGVMAVLIGGNEFRQYPIEQDKELSEMLLEGCIKFWERVEKGLPPEIDFMHRTTIGALKRMYPGTNGETITLPSELEHWHKVKMDADKEVKRYSSVVEACKARILAALEDNAIGILPDSAYQYKRGEVKKKEFTVSATSYIQMRGSAYKEKK